ncbi:MAG: Hsp70 family protein, partial [Deltaproteobacteria bacterium]|nr:Hsp70 family protein [Deltaproteobacteria bacterium]
AVGAAIQAGVLAGEVREVVLLDVTPLSLGLETLGGVMTTLIQRNTTIPTKKKETFTTAADNQTQVEIHVLQGERPMARDNRTLGRFHLIGLPAAPRGIPQVEVAFDIDANGILNVSAKDNATGKEQRITITASSGLDKNEVERMVKDAEGHADEDKRKKELIESRNQLDSLTYSTRKVLEENRARLEAAEIRDVEDALSEAEKALDKEEISDIKHAVERVTSASHRMAEALYKKSASTDEPPREDAQGKAGEAEVVDAEVVDEGGSKT